MKTICLVCTGNTCRSVMAEHILKNELKKNNLEYINVISCGLRVNKDDKTNDFAIKALKHIYYYPNLEPSLIGTVYSTFQFY